MTEYLLIRTLSGISSGALLSIKGSCLWSGGTGAAQTGVVLGACRRGYPSGKTAPDRVCEYFLCITGRIMMIEITCGYFICESIFYF